MKLWGRVSSVNVQKALWALAELELDFERIRIMHEVYQETAGYQLTFPVPQAMHFNETKLRGVLSAPLVLLNGALTRLDRTAGHRMASQFDSWVMRFRAPSREGA